MSSARLQGWEGDSEGVCEVHFSLAKYGLGSAPSCHSRCQSPRPCLLYMPARSLMEGGNYSTLPGPLSPFWPVGGTWLCILPATSKLQGHTSALPTSLSQEQNGDMRTYSEAAVLPRQGPALLSDTHGTVGKGPQPVFLLHPPAPRTERGAGWM